MLYKELISTILLISNNNKLGDKIALSLGTLLSVFMAEKACTTRAFVPVSLTIIGTSVAVNHFYRLKTNKL